MHEILKKIQQLGVVPVVVLHDAKDACPLAQALCDGGLPCAEVTFRTDAAADSIRLIKQHFPDMLVGAGTVLIPEQVDQAIEAGAEFIVSPGLSPAVVTRCIDKNIPITPGINNPTDIETALSFGLEVLKFFPAEPSGGLAMIKALSAPYPQITFMPTGGIHLENMGRYLSYPKVIACGGSWMASSELIQSGKFDTIKELTKETVQALRQIRPATP
ncbi:bifunctional 4-hydroxy-2-oxoglutarate aldolase/2-dehydro-3-deoxy-phosphogluconate aldolase [Lachnospiraceae bacterium 29-84]